MSDLPPAFPPIALGAFELRLTGRVLEDLGCSRTFSRTDFGQVEQSSPHNWVIPAFRNKYRESPIGTGISIGNVGRSDIYSLHGPWGGRAATWFDEDEEICWLLAFTPAHDYQLFENRASSGDLLPDERDYQILYIERETIDFDRLTVGPVKEMLRLAAEHPGDPVCRTVADLLEVELIASELRVDDRVLREFFLSVRVPPLSSRRPPGWPHREIPQRLLELATGYSRGRLALTVPTKAVAATGTRDIDWQHEIAVMTGPLMYPVGELDKFLDDDGHPIDHDQLMDRGSTN